MIDKDDAQMAFMMIRQFGHESVHEFLVRFKDSVDRLVKVGIVPSPAEELSDFLSVFSVNDTVS